MTVGAGKSRTRVRRGVSVIAGLLLLVALRPAVVSSTSRQETPAQEPVVRVIEERASPFNISAHVFILGNMGDIGTMTIESALREKAGRLEKSLRVSGSSNEQTRKKYDYRGQADIVKVLPLRADGSVDEEAVREWRGYESSASSSLKLNKRFQSEKIEFFRDHIVSTREDGNVREPRSPSLSGNGHEWLPSTQSSNTPHQRTHTKTAMRSTQ